MIRRDVRLADGAAGWTLISQIEHARLSGELAEHCVGRFSAPELAGVRREVLAAIRHHDDGWAEWERNPRLHVETGRPISFMELETSEAIDTWTRSCVAAEDEGPLAFWLVAGHFARLMENSEHARHDAAAMTWRRGVEQARREALRQWQSLEPGLHSEDLAGEALQWLWTFDEVSLWFCCTCPAGDELISPATGFEHAGAGTPVAMKLEQQSASAPAGQAVAAPWRLDQSSITLTAAAVVTPVVKYDNGAQLLASAAPVHLKWRLASA